MEVYFAKSKGSVNTRPISPDCMPLGKYVLNFVARLEYQMWAT